MHIITYQLLTFFQFDIFNKNFFKKKEDKEREKKQSLKKNAGLFDRNYWKTRSDLGLIESHVFMRGSGDCIYLFFSFTPFFF